jgi:hypothetical protein
MEGVEEYHHGEGGECVDQGCEQGHHGDQAAQETQQIQDEIAYEQQREQKSPDERQQGRMLESHAWSMNAAAARRKGLDKFCNSTIAEL